MAGHWFETILDNVTGRPVSGATVKVYTAAATISGDAVASGTFATIFSDDGVTSIDQASASYVTSDSRGLAEFWTNETSVVIEISYGGEAKKAISDVEIVGGTVASDVTTLAARVDKHDTVFGTAASAVDLGTFTGTTIADSSSVKTALQALETAVEGASSATDPLVISIAALADPNADRILFWDDSAGAMEWLTAGTGLAISGTTIAASGLASTTQTAEAISGFIASPSDKDYRIVVKMPHAGAITETTTRSASGTCTATFKVNTTALGGTANSVSSAEQSQAHASSNTFAADDDIVLTASSNSSCADMSFTIKYTRTLA